MKTDDRSELDNRPVLSEDNNRDRIIIRTSFVGIAANAGLAAMKAAIGFLSGSIAIVMDAVNNLSDAASSVITIVGTKLAGKQPDRKHPFGHGRVEYLTAMIISILVLYAGLTSFTESVKKIIHPKTPEYAPVMLIMIAAAVAVKIILGRYVTGMGRKVNSDSLVNSGEDATLDAVISASTLVAAVIYLTRHVSLEAWLGAVISVIIIKSGVDMLRETLSRILGERADADLVKQIKKTICSFPEVYGAYDLILNDYGPDTYHGSVHIEVPDTFTADELDELIRTITRKVYEEQRVILTAVGVYAFNTKDPRAVEVRQNIIAMVQEEPYILQTHGTYFSEEKKLLRFDAVVSFDAKNRQAVFEEFCRRIREAYPGYTVQIAMDTDFSE